MLNLGADGRLAFVERSEIDYIRAGENEENFLIQDQTNGEDFGEGFQVCFLTTRLRKPTCLPRPQDMKLEFITGRSMPWPNTFEKILKSRTKIVHAAKTRAQRRATGTTGSLAGKLIPCGFQGKGADNSEYVDILP